MYWRTQTTSFVDVVEVGSKIRFSIEGGFSDPEKDYPLSFEAEPCEFPAKYGLDPIKDIYFNFSTNQMYSLTAMSQNYAEKSCKLIYHVVDSKGFSSPQYHHDIVITRNVELAQAEIDAVGELVYMQLLNIDNSIDTALLDKEREI